MKKIIILLILSLALLTSCNSETTDNDGTELPETESQTAIVNDETESSSEESQTEPPTETAYYTVELDNGATIPMGAIADSTISELGAPNSVVEAPSCVYDGVDKVYGYGSFTVTTSPDANGNERISELSLTSDAVSFTNGISIGSDKAAVVDAFGTDYTESFGVLKFNLSGAEISVVIGDDGTVFALTVAAVY